MIKRIVNGVEIAMEESIELANSFSDNIGNSYEMLSDEIALRVNFKNFPDVDTTKMMAWVYEATDMLFDEFKQGEAYLHDPINEGVDYVLDKIEGIKNQTQNKDYYLHVKTDDIDKVKNAILETESEILYEGSDVMVLAMIEEADRLYETGMDVNVITDNVYYNLREILDQSVDEIIDDYMIKNSI